MWGEGDECLVSCFAVSKGKLVDLQCLSNDRICVTNVEGRALVTGACATLATSAKECVSAVQACDAVMRRLDASPAISSLRSPRILLACPFASGG